MTKAHIQEIRTAGGLDSARELRLWWQKLPKNCIVQITPQSRFGRSVCALFGSVRALCKISNGASATHPQKTPRARIIAALRDKEGAEPEANNGTCETKSGDHDTNMKCLNCNSDFPNDETVCWNCHNDLVPETARSDADSIRVQRVVGLLARWRDESVAMDEIAYEEGDDECTLALTCRERSRTLRACANALEVELAGTVKNE